MRHVLLFSAVLGLATPALAEPGQEAAADSEPGAVGPRVISETRQGMSTKLQILVYAADESAARAAIQAAFAELERIEALLSEWRPDSETSRLNQAAGKQPVPLSAETLTVLEAGLRFFELSRGAFSLTWAALASLWDFSPGNAAKSIPGADRIGERLALVNDSKLLIDRVGSTARLAEPGMAVGLGGIAKGYAIDRALAVLREHGVASALVFAGGDIAVMGSKGKKPWLIGIQDPRAVGYFGVLPLAGGAVATSGDYEHFFEAGGRRYHHILDPRTGLPAGGTRSVTVIAPDAMTADGLATAVFVLGPEQGMRLVESQEGVEAVIVDESNQVLISSGLEERLRVVRPPSE